MKVFCIWRTWVKRSSQKHKFTFSLLLFLSEKVEFAKVLVPKDIALKAATIPNFEVYAISNLTEALNFS